MSDHEEFRRYLNYVEAVAHRDLAQFPMPLTTIDGRSIQPLRADINYVTLVGDTHRVVEFEVVCKGCGVFFTFISATSFPIPRFKQRCLECSPSWQTPESRAKAFETRCRNLGITQEEAHARRAKALGLDGMV